nr:MBL fold metallo-hydrolase [Motilibacter aurantiacus]
MLLLGVRGSLAAPGADHVRYGGNTSCVAVCRDDELAPTLCLDAGTGLRRLSGLLGGRAYSGAILLTHLHWDHVQGIPFFAAGDRSGSQVDVYLPAQDGRSARDLLSQSMSPPAFPITPEGLRGSWRFRGLEPGRHVIAGFLVHAAEVTHKGGRTYGYRVSDGVSSCAYVPDHAPALGCPPEVGDLVRDVDVLLHDAQFLASERALADAYGHATVADAVALAVQARARTLVLTHHAPARVDDDLDALLHGARRLAATSARPSLQVRIACEGETLRVGGLDA